MKGKKYKKLKIFYDIYRKINLIIIYVKEKRIKLEKDREQKRESNKCKTEVGVWLRWRK